MGELIVKLERRIGRVKSVINKMENYKADTHTFYGGWSLGYYQGRLSALEDLLDELELINKYVE